jgi:phage terminase small subunit
MKLVLAIAAVRNKIILVSYQGGNMAFWDKMKKAVKEGLETSKDVLEKAKDKTKELGEKGALKFEIMQLEKQAEKRFCKIGTHVYEVLVKDGQQKISKGTPEIKNLLQEIEEIENNIDQKEKELERKAD